MLPAVQSHRSLYAIYTLHSDLTLYFNENAKKQKKGEKTEENGRKGWMGSAKAANATRASDTNITKVGLCKKLNVLNTLFETRCYLVLLTVI